MKTMILATLPLYVLILNAKSGAGSEIIGGSEVKPHSLPFMAYVTTGKSYCGGTLINEKWVLTAAHCNDNRPVETVILGLHSLQNADKDKNLRQERKVKRRVIHPCYNKELIINDLMLLELDQAVVETDSVKWLSVKTVKYPKSGTDCETAGWGRTTYFNGVKSEVLLSSKVTVRDRFECKVKGEFPFITGGMICAGFFKEKQGGPWLGDSGGPLLCGKDKLVGVTSMGKPLVPSVFAYLSKERVEWIQKTTKD